MNTEHLVAWEGPVCMVEAKWTDKDGSLVRLKLLNVNEEERNPFVKFTKRRKGAGTRFAAGIRELEPPHNPIYKDEAMLAGWNDSQNGGMTVTLWLAQDRMGHPFEGVSRKTKLKLILIELDDDEEEIDQQARERVEAAGSHYRSPSERPSYAAAMLCKNPDFWEWINAVYGEKVAVWTEEHAATWLRGFLNVGSRGELDRNEALTALFRAKIQNPFSVWRSPPTSTTSGSFGAASPAIQSSRSTTAGQDPSLN